MTIMEQDQGERKDIWQQAKQYDDVRKAKDNPAARPLKTKQKCDGNFTSTALRYQEQLSLFECSQVSPACPSDRVSIKMKMSMKHWWKDTDRGKQNY
jgi:hypothetical protein